MRDAEMAAHASDPQTVASYGIRHCCSRRGFMGSATRWCSSIRRPEGGSGGSGLARLGRGRAGPARKFAMAPRQEAGNIRSSHYEHRRGGRGPPVKSEMCFPEFSLDRRDPRAYSRGVPAGTNPGAPPNALIALSARNAQHPGRFVLRFTRVIGLGRDVGGAGKCKGREQSVEPRSERATASDVLLSISSTTTGSVVRGLRRAGRSFPQQRGRLRATLQGAAPAGQRIVSLTSLTAAGPPARLLGEGTGSVAVGG